MITVNMILTLTDHNNTNADYKTMYLSALLLGVCDFLAGLAWLVCPVLSQLPLYKLPISHDVWF